MVVAWSFPTRILFGESAIEHLPAELDSLGARKALLVTDKGVLNADVAEPIFAVLRKRSIEWEVFDDVDTNPTEAQALAAIEKFRAGKAEVIVGLGGGAPLDVAKLVRLGATHPGPLAQYDDAKGGSERIKGPLPSMVAIPTTAGTGSEVGRSAVVTLEETHRKTVIFSPLLMPNVAILDPALTVSLPARPTAATGFDALTHNIEAYCALGDHPMADAIGLEGIGLVHSYLERAVSKGTDIEARGGMLKAAMMGAVAFQKGLGACHSLAHPLSAEFGLHHGLANALCLPAVLDFNRAAIPVKIAHIARILGARGEDIETLAFECSGAIRALRRKVGLPEGLAEVGVHEEHIQRLSSLAFEDGCHQNNPRPCTRDELAALYRASL